MIDIIQHWFFEISKAIPRPGPRIKIKLELELEYCLYVYIVLTIIKVDYLALDTNLIYHVNNQGP